MPGISWKHILADFRFFSYWHERSGWFGVPARGAVIVRMTTPEDISGAGVEDINIAPFEFLDTLPVQVARCGAFERQMYARLRSVGISTNHRRQSNLKIDS